MRKQTLKSLSEFCGSDEKPWLGNADRGLKESGNEKKAEREVRNVRRGGEKSRTVETWKVSEEEKDGEYQILLDRSP